MNVLLLSNGPGISLQVLYCLRAMGVRPHVFGSKNARILRSSRFVASFTENELAEDDACANALARVIAALGIDLVVPGDEHTTRILVRIASRLPAASFPLADEATFRLLSDKWAFHGFCTEHGIPVPRTVFVGARAQIDGERLEAELGPNLVIKPTNEGNSNGVVICDSGAALQRLVGENADYPYAPLIAQEFIPGIDVDCSILASNGRVVCSAVQRREDGRFLFGGYDVLADLCERIAAQSGLNGVAHFDARLDSRDNAVKLLECNPRFWASITAALWCGINFVEEGIQYAQGRPVNGKRVLADATYLPWTKMASHLLHRHFPAVHLARPERAGLANAVADPLPVILDELSAWRGRRAERARLVRRSNGH
jgi:predicted ATP-grasp superfamily ATP-dependent carboligase